MKGELDPMSVFLLIVVGIFIGCALAHFGLVR